MIGDILQAYQIIKQQKARDKSLKRFISKDPDYLVIRSLIEQARMDVVATITWPNGVKLDLTRRDAMDRMQAMMSQEQAGSY